MKMSVPAFELLDGPNNSVFECESYDELYAWAKEHNEKFLGTLLACAEITVLFGKQPLVFDMKNNRLFTCEWKEVPLGSQTSNDNRQVSERSVPQGS